MDGAQAHGAEARTPVGRTGVRGGVCRPRSVGRRFGLALDRGLAHQDRLALEAVQRLDELEVLGAAELDRRARRAVAGCRLGLELLARFLARLLAGLVLLLGTLAAHQV